MPDTDEQLILRMARRDESALLELHRRYARYLKALAWRMLHDDDEAEQCVQDAFLNAWNAAERFDATRASAKTWLVSIGHHRCLNALRARREQSLPLESWDAPTERADLDDQHTLRQAVDTLEDEGRELIELAFYQGYSHSEVALLTGKPLGTVKAKLRAALIQLRRYFGEVKP